MTTEKPILAAMLNASELLSDGPSAADQAEAMAQRIALRNAASDLLDAARVALSFFAHEHPDWDVTRLLTVAIARAEGRAI